MPDSCICCESGDAVPHLEGLLRCTRCSHVWADMRIPEDELRRLYAENYFKGDEYLDYEREEHALRRNFRQVITELRRRLPEGGRLWEVGTAYGYFLDEARAFFDVSGCDISEAAVARAVDRFGLRVTCSDYLEKPRDVAFDAVCLWDTIEHLAAPDRYLRKAHEELRPGGVLALSTGDIGAWTARIRGPHWRLIHPPTHLHYFTARSMRTLLQRMGFDAIGIRHRVFWRSADAVAYRVLHHGGSKASQRAYDCLRRTGLLRFAFPMNTFDLMTVFATKQGAARS